MTRLWPSAFFRGVKTITARSVKTDKIDFLLDLGTRAERASRSGDAAELHRIRRALSPGQKQQAQQLRESNGQLIADFPG